MTDHELERRLEQALSHAAPDDLNGVLSRCETRNGAVIPMTATKKNSRTLRNLVAACLALALVGGGGGLFYQQTRAVASVVSLDVNPSIEMTVNRYERVLSCTPLNEEAREILSDMGSGADLKGTKLDVAVNAIVGALVRHGYLDSISSAILISVEDKNADRAAKLQRELTEAVDSVLQEQSAGASVLSQTMPQDPELETQARESNISTGKAYLVRQVMEMNGTIATSSATALDRLSALTVEELNDLLETGEMRIPIGKGAAAYAAEEYAGTLAVDSVTAQVDPELDETPAYYEVELHHPSLGKFDYQVDAFTGQVLSGKANILRTQPSQDPPEKGDASFVGEDKAKQAALAHAGIQEQEVQSCKAWIDYDDGRPEHYQVEFAVGGREYEYEIDLYSAAVLKFDSEAKASGGTGGSRADVGAEQAKTAALSHAGVRESQTAGLKVKQDEDDGRLEYEVEFWVDDTEYEYTIDGATGAVLSYESEEHQRANSADIGVEEAKSAALTHAGVQESQVTEMKVEREEDDGRLEYEVEFRAGNMEYEYTIDGSSGAVLKHESDWDD